jgi:hypothetical protein
VVRPAAGLRHRDVTLRCPGQRRCHIAVRLRCGCGAAGAGVAGRAVRAVPLMGLVPSRGRAGGGARRGLRHPARAVTWPGVPRAPEPAAGAGGGSGAAGRTRQLGPAREPPDPRARGRARASHSDGAAPMEHRCGNRDRPGGQVGIGCTMGTTRPAPRPLAVKSPIQAENHWSGSRTRPKRSCDPAARTDNLRIAHSILSVARSLVVHISST